MAEVLAKHTPQAVRVPAGAGVERSFAEYEISDETRALCDATTVFCDVFRSANGKEVVCIGPPFLDLGYPRAVRLAGRRRRFVVEEAPWGKRRASILRVLGTSDVDSADDPDVDLQVDFPEFGIDVQVRLPGVVPSRPHVALTLATVQKDNELQWLVDWSRWHHRAHGVGRFIFYDNGSADRDAVHAELARRVKGPELIVVDWDYPYGPPRPFELNFAQTVALNHCRLFFGPYTHWCINLDVDEYLFNTGSEPLASHLGRVRKPHVHLPQYIVPMVVDNRPRRCFDSPFRSASLDGRGRKYVYRPAEAAFTESHDVATRATRLLWHVRNVVKRGLLGIGVDPGRLAAAARRVATRAGAFSPGRPGRAHVGRSTAMDLICAKWWEAVCSTLTLIKSAERRAPSAERRAPSAERRAPSAERRAPSAERRAPSAERRAPSAERRAPSAERRAPSAERRAPSAERRAPSAERRAPSAERRAPSAERRAPTSPRCSSFTSAP